LLSAESLNFVSSPIIKELVPAAMKNTFNKQNDSVHPVFYRSEKSAKIFVTEFPKEVK
jgi:hypothetical protein